MSARPIATATVSFGLVSVPVKLYSTGESGRKISFNWMHEKCGTRLKQRYYCPKDGETVERDEMIKGYEFAKEQELHFLWDTKDDFHKAMTRREKKKEQALLSLKAEMLSQASGGTTEEEEVSN